VSALFLATLSNDMTRGWPV